MYGIRAISRGFAPRARLCAGFLLLALTACKGPAADTAPPPPEVGVIAVAPRDARLTDAYNGRVEAVDAVALRPRVSGYLDRVAFKEGDSVRQGDLLFVIDPRPYRNALARAEAQARQAGAAANLARLQLARVRTLMAARATSQEELDGAAASHAQAQATLQAAQAAVADARLQLSFTEVRAPIAGRIGRALMTAGNLAQADQSLLGTLVSQDPVYVYFDSDEHSYLGYLKSRAAADGRPFDGAEVRIGLADGADFPHTGVIDFVDNRLDAATGTMRLRARVDNAGGALTPGMYARVQLGTPTPRPVILVAERAVLTDQNRKYVYVVGPDDKALRRDVTIGRKIGGERIIESGLAAGDRVVADGMQKIFYPGAPVKPVALATRDGAAGPAQ
ncbi:efflux RND transporter periplasmic adaptor subunit [Bordetella genomosp. 1]|uniref:Efflux transporter periplasmic adaptor subunit n=1 Tax=Bordetella genomosp. 1 TaxID=1395607 RepID=A0ABX4F4H3_9BORD|nr:efflux RND transporter periplasmic adaptor subunit [Bordetella genomosp. 1]OZI68674.1 efflux transporter periplasmic adaptor subunit [Bordetella genomosp. 1]